MKVIEKQEDNSTNKIMIISHRFNNFPNIVCSGSKIYQLPCQIGKKSFNIKELKPKYHQGSIVYIINSKRINSKTLKINVLKVNEEFILEKIEICPF
jgi:hypothetical protein